MITGIAFSCLFSTRRRLPEWRICYKEGKAMLYKGMLQQSLEITVKTDPTLPLCMLLFGHHFLSVFLICCIQPWILFKQLLFAAQVVPQFVHIRTPGISSQLFSLVLTTIALCLLCRFKGVNVMAARRPLNLNVKNLPKFHQIYIEQVHSAVKY